MNEEEIINKAVDHIEYVLTYGLQNDVTEEEIDSCKKLMRVFLTTHSIKSANNLEDRDGN